MKPDLITRWKQEAGIRQATFRQRMPVLRRRKGPALDAEAANLHRETFASLDCLTCANCCKTIPPIVNRTDASRIARHLKIAERTFYQQYLRIDEDGDTVMNTSPCPFLMPDNHCRIYDQRPKACRAYPHTDENFSKHLDLHLRNTIHCPAVFRIMEKLTGLQASSG